MLQAKDQLDVMEPNSDHRYFLSVIEHNLLYRPNRPCEVMDKGNRGNSSDLYLLLGNGKLQLPKLCYQQLD